MLEELREKAYKILSSGKWLSVIASGDRKVQIKCDGSFDCHSSNNFDPEFTTADIETAINYLYPKF